MIGLFMALHAQRCGEQWFVFVGLVLMG